MRIKVLLLTAVGFLSLALGAIGLLLPVWPTTPFVLVAAGCFSGTPRLRAKLLRISFFREYIESYQAKTGLSRRTVTVSLSFLWGMLILSALLVQAAWLRLLLAGVGAAVTAHILWIAGARR